MSPHALEAPVLNDVRAVAPLHAFVQSITSIGVCQHWAESCEKKYSALAQALRTDFLGAAPIACPGFVGYATISQQTLWDSAQKFPCFASREFSGCQPSMLPYAGVCSILHKHGSTQTRGKPGLWGVGRAPKVAAQMSLKLFLREPSFLAVRAGYCRHVSFFLPATLCLLVCHHAGVVAALR